MTHFFAEILCLVAAQAGPIGWWRGDDGTAPTTAADSSGNNRDGMYAGGATTSATSLPTGIFNNESAFQLDGTDDQITVAHNAAFNLTGDMTVAFWMRRAAQGSDYQRMVGKGAPAVRTFGIWLEAAANSRVLFQQYNGSGGSVLDLWTTETIGLTAWKHIACTISGTGTATTTAKIYFDGVEKATATRATAPGTDSQPVRIGYGEIHAYFPGQIDEVRLFNSAIPVSDILILAGTPPSEAPTGLNFTNTTPGGTTLNWTAAAGANTYVVQRGPVGGPYVTIASDIAALSYTDSGLTPGTSYAYVVYAVGLVNSADSGPATVLIPMPPPRTNDHGEGLFDDSCACGSTAPGGYAGTAVLVALALLALRRR